MPLPQGEEAERCRLETKARLAAFCKILDEKLPDGDVLCSPPESYQLAATVEIELVHRKGNRRLNYHSAGPATLNNLTAVEKERIATAVGEAADLAGLEVLFKPSHSGPGLLVYRLFWKPSE